MSRYFTNDEDAQIKAHLKNHLLEGGDLTFFARDLGFDDHTMIHEAVKPILAEHTARLMLRYLGPEAKARFLQEAQSLIEDAPSDHAGGPGMGRR